jgi:hypothetical protein
MHLRRVEFIFWTLAVLVAPWAAYGAWVHLVGQPGGDGPLRHAAVGFAVALWLAIGGRLAPRLAWASRVPIVAFRLWLNRRWRWTYAIAPEPIAHGTRRIWVSRALQPDERSAAACVAAALDALAAVQPSRAARLERLGVQFAVLPMHAVAGYLPSANVLAVDPATALAESVEVLASIIVHESNHALLASRGLVHPLLQPRSEHLARLDQWLFGRRLFLLGNQDDVRRISELVTGAMHADDSVPAHWRRVKSGVDRLQEGLQRMYGQGHR